LNEIGQEKNLMKNEGEYAKFMVINGQNDSKITYQRHLCSKQESVDRLKEVQVITAMP
jgi:hypothetical protein